MKHVPAFLLLLAACSPNGSQNSAPQTSPAPTPTPPPAAPKKTPTGLIAFQPPAAWIQEEPSSNMRKAQFRIKDKQSSAKDAELALFYFGANPAMIEANIERWQGQVDGSDAKPEVFQGKCRVTLVDLSGTYSGDAGSDPLPNARMLAAVVEAAEGPWYFKMVGPADTVGDWREEFVAMLKSAGKATE